jgi:hypothetical protein
MKTFLCIILCFFLFGSKAQTVYKSYTPSKFPDRISMGWNSEETATNQSVNWRTDSTMQNGVGEIALANANPDFTLETTSVSAITQKVVLDGKTAYYHTVHFSDLQPNTKYSYRVGSGGYWSEWFHFTTANSKSQPFSFMYFGDAQNDIRSLWSRAVRGAYSNFPTVNFMIHAGDLINNANFDWQWGEWFEASGWINGMVPTIATPGNHEYFRETGNTKLSVSKHWKPSFVLPENGPEGFSETAYHFYYQGTLFISLDSQKAISDSLALNEQAKWLIGILEKNKSQWIVIFHHHPIYSTKAGRDNLGWRKIMEPIYKKYNVDLVLQGHDHTYGRGINMPLGRTRKFPDGPIYVVSVSGPKMYDIGLQDWMDRAGSSIQLYQIIGINGTKLSYKSYSVTGEVYDSFEITKSKKGKNILHDQAPNLSSEKLELPAEFKKRYTPQQMKEYENRFENYKKRKEAKPF